VHDHPQALCAWVSDLHTHPTLTRHVCEACTPSPWFKAHPGHSPAGVQWITPLADVHCWAPRALASGGATAVELEALRCHQQTPLSPFYVFWKHMTATTSWRAVCAYNSSMAGACRHSSHSMTPRPARHSQPKHNSITPSWRQRPALPQPDPARGGQHATPAARRKQAQRPTASTHQPPLPLGAARAPVNQLLL
jgi:hypothetical protein